jgi:hypothetical protein
MKESEFKEEMFKKLVSRKIYKDEERKLFEREYEQLKDEFGLFLEILNEHLEKEKENWDNAQLEEE